MINKATLKEIGLTDNEIKVYLKLLELGETLASKVGSQVGLNRTHSYDVLESLIERGLVSYVINNNRKYFSATNPIRLIEYIKEKEESLKQKEEEIQNLIPQLLKLKAENKEEEKVEIYKGKEGIKTIYNDILNSVKEYYVLGATGQIAKYLQYYFPGHEKQRIKKGIKLKLLFNEELRGQEITKRELAEIRFLPKSYSSPIPTTIYGNRVVILVWKTPAAIIIEDKEIANTYKNYFNLLWGLAKS